MLAYNLLVHKRVSGSTAIYERVGTKFIVAAINGALYHQVPPFQGALIEPGQCRKRRKTQRIIRGIIGEVGDGIMGSLGGSDGGNNNRGNKNRNRELSQGGANLLPWDYSFPCSPASEGTGVAGAVWNAEGVEETEVAAAVSG